MYDLFKLHDYVDEKYPSVRLEVTTTRDRMTLRLSKGDNHISFIVAREEIETALVPLLELGVDNAVKKLSVFFDVEVSQVKRESENQ